MRSEKLATALGKGLAAKVRYFSKKYQNKFVKQATLIADYNESMDSVVNEDESP